MTPTDHRTPSVGLTAPEPRHELSAGNGHVYVYSETEQMGLATAINVASHQMRLFEEKGFCSAGRVRQ